MPTEPDFFEPDKNRLDEEWIRQPGLYHEHALKEAEARAAWERAKANRDVVEAEVEMEVRQNPLAHGLDKVTEAGVGKAVLLDKRYRKADAAVLIAKHELDVVGAAVSALDHRKKALENLVQLRLADYFSEPRVKGGAGEQMRRVEHEQAFRGRKRE